MSAIRSLKRSTEQFLVGQRLNRYDVGKEGRSRKQNREALKAAVARIGADPMRHSSFRKEVYRRVNEARGDISLAQAIAEGQI